MGTKQALTAQTHSSQLKHSSRASPTRSPNRSRGAAKIEEFRVQNSSAPVFAAPRNASKSMSTRLQSPAKSRAKSPAKSPTRAGSPSRRAYLGGSSVKHLGQTSGMYPRPVMDRAESPSKRASVYARKASVRDKGAHGGPSTVEQSLAWM